MTPLRQRMIEDMRLRNLGPHTQRAYLQYVSQFAGHFHRSPEMLGPAEIRAFQLHLSRDRQLSASSVGVASCCRDRRIGRCGVGWNEGEPSFEGARHVVQSQC